MRLVDRVQLTLRDYIKDGDVVIDATIGNGHDTLFLADLVGESGVVFGFDIQETAIKNTLDKLTQANLNQRVTLFKKSHEQMDVFTPPHIHGNISVVMFNLGYLPGGNKSIITLEQSTLIALEKALKLLKPNGLVSVTVYPGHPGGDAEAQAIENWVKQLPPQQYNIATINQDLSTQPSNNNNKPYALLIQKMKRV